MKDDKKKNKTSAIACTPSVQVFQKPSVFPKAFSKKFNDRMMRQASEIFDCEVKVQPMDFSAKFKKRVLPESTNNMGGFDRGDVFTRTRRRNDRNPGFEK
jgi:hypothetical protein